MRHVQVFQWRKVITGGLAMKRSGVIGVVILLASLLAGNAWADRYGHGYYHPRSSVQFGLYMGAPWPYYPPPFSYYYAPPVYAPPVVVMPPPVYVEQRQAVPVLESGYWYYCNESQAYYPHVSQCAGPWVKVPPQPPR
jgi:hypothetical protein